MMEWTKNKYIMTSIYQIDWVKWMSEFTHNKSSLSFEAAASDTL